MIRKGIDIDGKNNLKRQALQYQIKNKIEKEWSEYSRDRERLA